MHYVLTQIIPYTIAFAMSKAIADERLSLLRWIAVISPMFVAEAISQLLQ